MVRRIYKQLDRYFPNFPFRSTSRKKYFLYVQKDLRVRNEFELWWFSIPLVKSMKSFFKLNLKVVIILTVIKIL